MYRRKDYKGGVAITYETKVKKLRKQVHRKIRHAQNERREKQGLANLLQPTPYRHVLFKLTILLAVGIGLIVLLPTFVVQLTKATPPEEEVAEESVELATEEEDELAIEVTVERENSKEMETVPLETYVASVVASEMPADFELAALKAQAVAARTYIVNHLLHKKEDPITDTVNHQVYQNKEELQSLWGSDFQWKWEKITQAVKETEKEILTYKGQPITPTFFSMSNGYTEDAKHYWGNDLPYLKSVESKWEEKLPNFKKQEIFTLEELQQRLGLEGLQTKPLPIKIKRTPSNRVSEVAIGSQTFTGREMREKLNLRSTDFTISQRDEHVIITTKGYGHGVGMSQHGANEMAKEGKNYKAILTHYYQDVAITPLDDVAPMLVMND